MNLHLSGKILPENKEADLYVTDGHITFQKVKDAKTIVDKGYILPGLIDAHAHLSLNSPAQENAIPQEAVKASAKAHLHAGVLAIREPGSPDYAALGLHVEDGFPRIQTAGRFLAPHGKYFPGLAREIAEENLTIAAEEEFKKSGKWVKVIGDYFDNSGNLVPNFKLETLKKAVGHIHKLGGRIATHVVCVEAIELAIEAGFDSIEHATAIQPIHLKEMARKKIAFTPTMTIRQGILDMWKSMGSAIEYVKTEKAVKNQAKIVRKAFDIGLTVLAGTDAGMVAHGIVSEEINNFIKAGVVPEVALGAGSWNARKYLGYSGIEEGARADLVVFDKDPRISPEVLKNPYFIMLDGFQVMPQ